VAKGGGAIIAAGVLAGAAALGIAVAAGAFGKTTPTPPGPPSTDIPAEDGACPSGYVEDPNWPGYCMPTEGAEPTVTLDIAFYGTYDAAANEYTNAELGVSISSTYNAAGANVIGVSIIFDGSPFPQEVWSGTEPLAVIFSAGAGDHTASAKVFFADGTSISSPTIPVDLVGLGG
jgi:hypothetical protein